MGRSFNIVVAGTDPRMRTDYLDLLPRLGHQVVAAHDTRELVDLCRLLLPDLILTDPDGITASIHVNSERMTPVILVLADYDAEMRERAVLHHIVACLVKPVNPQDLALAIDLAMMRFRQEQSLRQEAADLRQALSDRKVIERAKGAVMRRIGLDESEAYRQLRRLSSNGNQKLVDVAHAVVAAEEIFGGLDDLPAGEGLPPRGREAVKNKASRSDRPPRKQRRSPCGSE